MEANAEKIACNLFDWNRPYLWPMPQDEKGTVNGFNKFFSAPLLEALTYNGDTLKSKVSKVIFKIIEWGGTYKGSKRIEKATDDFTNRFLRLLEKKYDYKKIKNNVKDNMCIIEEIVKFGGEKSSDFRIASWSKILAAFQPGIFFIYDSRVAMALNFCDGRKWRIPLPRTSNKKEDNDKSNKFIKDLKIRNDGTPDVPTCYFNYLQQLENWASAYEAKYDDEAFRPIREAYEAIGFDKKQAVMAHLEKMLFMMKESIMEEMAGQKND